MWLCLSVSWFFINPLFLLLSISIVHFQFTRKNFQFTSSRGSMATNQLLRGTINSADNEIASHVVNKSVINRSSEPRERFLSSPRLLHRRIRSSSVKPVDRIYWVIRNRWPAAPWCAILFPHFHFLFVARIAITYLLFPSKPLGNDPCARSRFVDRELIETWKDRSIL